MLQIRSLFLGVLLVTGQMPSTSLILCTAMDMMVGKYDIVVPINEDTFIQYVEIVMHVVLQP